MNRQRVQVLIDRLRNNPPSWFDMGTCFTCVMGLAAKTEEFKVLGVPTNRGNFVEGIDLVEFLSCQTHKERTGFINIIIQRHGTPAEVADQLEEWMNKFSSKDIDICTPLCQNQPESNPGQSLGEPAREGPTISLITQEN